MKILQNSRLLALLILATLVANCYQTICPTNCMACNHTTGFCEPLSCNWGYSRQADGTCLQISTVGAEGIMQDAQTTSIGWANAEGFNRMNASTPAGTTLTGTTACSAACSDAGCLMTGGVEHCYGCRTAWPTNPSANLAGGVASDPATWIAYYFYLQSSKIDIFKNFKKFFNSKFDSSYPRILKII
jgi:hypothetical protein